MDESMAGARTLQYHGKPELRDPIVAALRTVFDPEIPVDIFELGLVYKVEVSEAGAAAIEMTLTSPACPSAEQIPVDVQERVGAIPGVTSVRVDVVWDPPWNPDFMSEAAKLMLGMY
jgi:FeS assembly SUF system protein